MSIISDLKLDLITTRFQSIFDKIDSMENIHEILGGADTRIIAVDIHTANRMIPVVIRLFRENSGNRAEWEFNLLRQINKSGVNTPVPYFFDISDPNWSFYTMQRIDGMNFVDKLLKNKEGQNGLLRQFYSVMVKLHQIDPSLVPLLKEQEPRVSIISEIQRSKRIIENYEITELFGILNYLETELDNIEFTQPVLLHGDFHPNNVLLSKDDRLYIIDWTNVYLGDFRVDLAFSITAFNSIMGDLTDYFVKIYEGMSKRSVEQIEYFMVLSNFFNILRIYSCVNNNEITNETEGTTKLFLEDIKYYSSYITNLFSKITGVELPSMQKVLKREYLREQDAK